MDFLRYLEKQGVIRPGDTEKILAEAQSTGKDVYTLLQSGGIDSKRITELRGAFYNLPVQTLQPEKITFEILKYIPEESAVHYQFVPLGVENGVLEVGLVDPDNMQARDALQFISTKSGMPFKIFLISEEDFKKVIEAYKGLRGEVSKALKELESDITGTEGEEFVKKEEEPSPTAPLSTSGGEQKSAQEAKIIEEAPVTKIVAVMLRHATEGNASDIHIEHTEDKVRVRFRVDGVLYTSLLLPANVHNAVVARIKILSNLKLDEKRKPQDGRFSARIEGRKIDFRVSTFPAYYGEKVVMRILDPEKGTHTLDTLGLSPSQYELVTEAIRAPHGIILLTGPTGSGKTTTLYSMIGEIDKEKVNVVSLEDPVEYNISGMNQSQVRPEIGYTFANGLRSILRQDPDVIMVGEIRDKETAQLAIQAALTGHLVFSTLHTNNAVGVVPRLIDMGVDPYLIAPTLRLAVAQRLSRTICPDARKQVPIDDSTRLMIEKEFAGLPENIQKDVREKAKFIYKAESTPNCPSGTRGRTAVFEMLRIDKELEQIILTNPVEPEIEKAARSKGMMTLRQDAILRALDGTIPFEEVYKV